jgi:hypothetical protein
LIWMITMFKSHHKLKLLLSLGALFLPLLAGGCNQDSIFDDISWETAPTEPKIKGAPSKIVQANIGNGNKLYIANGRLWEYDLSASGGSWNHSDGPGGYVVDVASASGASGDILYALAIDNTSTETLKNDGTGWIRIDPPGDYGFVQNIFGAGDTLFAAGATRSGNDNDYAILYCRQQDSQFNILTETGKAPLTGAGVAGADHYLATLGSGIYKVPFPFPNSGSPAADPATESYIPSVIAGFLQEKAPDPSIGEPGVIIGISRSGHIFRIDSSGVKDPGASLGGIYTGSLALMASPDPQPAPQGSFDKLLLLGFRGSTSYKHGYVEVQFDSANGTPDMTRRIPGENQPSSIQEYRQYDSSLRRYPVEALWVLQDPDPKSPSVIFAATSNQGVYSYRNRSDGGWQWNHEE